MCNASCIRFGLEAVTPEDVRGRRVLEVGSYDVNGSLRPGLTALGPARYLGVDLEEGPGVDEICDATEIVARHGEAAWDVVVCTELLEHVWDWRAVVRNLKGALAPGGKLVVTTRSIGFPYHLFPFDFWRFEVPDARMIFGDLVDLRVEPDPEMAGVFVAGVKPEPFAEKDLSDHFVYSMLTSTLARDPETSLIEEYVGHLRAERDRIDVSEAAHLRLLESLRGDPTGEASAEGSVRGSPTS